MSKYEIDLTDPEWVEWAARNVGTDDVKTGELVVAISEANKSFVMEKGLRVRTATQLLGVVTHVSAEVVVVWWDDVSLSPVVFTAESDAERILYYAEVQEDADVITMTEVPFPWKE